MTRADIGLFTEAIKSAGYWKMLFYQGVRYLLAAVFLWSGITKLLDPVSFGVLIDAYGLIPKTWVMPAAILLSSLEVIAGAGLILDISGSLAIITGMVILFIAILVLRHSHGPGYRLRLLWTSGPRSQSLSMASHGALQRLFADGRSCTCTAGVLSDPSDPVTGSWNTSPVSPYKEMKFE